jgi:acyl-homoserine-lactone acylase
MSPCRGPAAGLTRLVMNASLRRPYAALLSVALAGAAVSFLAAGCGDDTVLATGDGGTVDPYKATIRRTSQGIPHVKADDFGGLGYGYGYAFAEDNLCILLEEIMTARGERAKFLGDKPYDLGNTDSKSNILSDAVYKMIIPPDSVAKSRAGLDPDMQAAVTGYAAGVSRYVRDLRAGGFAGRHASCRNEPWVREIKDEDLYYRFMKLVLIASSANFIDAIAAAQPTSALVGPPAPPESHDVTPAKMREGLERIAPKFMALRRGEVGSNMYAFGSEVTGGGGIQFGNPHFPWYGGERLYQVHLTIPGKMDVQGASLYGVPVVLIGFTSTFAWSHTVSSAYRFTPYALTLKAGDPLTYVVDGEEKKITKVETPIEVKLDGGGTRTEVVPLYRSEYGPMIYLGNAAFEWSAERAFTIRDANAENFRFVRNFARWNMAKDLAEFTRIHAEEVAVPWVNTTAADKDGNAYYGDLSVVPNVPDELAEACKVPILSGVLAGGAPGLPLLDGSKKSCAWASDPDSRQPGAFGPGKLPATTRKDWVVNCNDSFWLTNTKAPITGYADIIGREGYEQTLRSRLCHQQVLDRVAGTDGLPGTNVTADLVKQIVVGARVFSAERFKAQALTALCAAPTIQLTRDPLTKTDVTPPVDVNVQAACAALGAWDNRNNTDSKGSLAWDEFWFRVEALRSANTTVFKVPFDAADPINTPRDLKTEEPLVAQAFAAAVKAVQESGFAFDAPRSAFSFREGKGGERIPVPGGFQRTGNFTIAQVSQGVATRPILNPGTGYGPLNYGNSYMQVVAFGANGVDASTFVTYSESTDPASPHYDDYTRAYSTKSWLKAAFTEAEVAADTKETIELGK